MKLATRQKKQQILARIRTNRKIHLATADLAINLALGSAQIMNIISQPIHPHPQHSNGGHQLVFYQQGRGSGKTFAQGGLVNDPAAAGIIARHWCPDPDDGDFQQTTLERTWQALDSVLRGLLIKCASDARKVAEIEKKRAILAAMQPQIQQVAKSIKELNQASTFFDVEQKRIRMKQLKKHQRTCRNRNGNIFQPLFFQSHSHKNQKNTT